MPKLEYDDDTLNHNRLRLKRNQSFALIISVIIVSLVMGVIGGVGGMIMLTSRGGDLANKLGIADISDITLPTVKEKIVLEESSAIIDSSKKVSDAVVSITLKSTAQDMFGRVYEQEGAGTGFIITSDGLIITNKHVVSDLNASYTVVTNDGATYDAKIQSADPYQDLAVIKIEARNLPVVELGDSDELSVGQWVVAVGNALGQFENTVTVGVISAKNRTIEASDSNGARAETLEGLLQTDAAINSGNSGGPLVNLKGQVVGINTAVASGAQSIGFAIPINTAKSAIESIKTTGKIIRPYLGVRYVAITKEIAAEANLSVDYGALIKSGSKISELAVIPGSPADKAGLAENDIILEVNGEKINTDNSLVKLIQQYKVGDTVELKVLSKGNDKTVKVKLEEGK